MQHFSPHRDNTLFSDYGAYLLDFEPSVNDVRKTETQTLHSANNANAAISPAWLMAMLGRLGSEDEKLLSEKACVVRGQCVRVGSPVNQSVYWGVMCGKYFLAWSSNFLESHCHSEVVKQPVET